MEYGVISVLIPIFTIVLALATKDAIVSLAIGIFAGLFVVDGYSFFNAFLDFFNGIVELFSKGWIVKTILFTLFVGAIIKLLEDAKIIDSFIAYLDKKSKKIDSYIGAQLMAYIIGLLIFIESSITSLVAGAVSQKLCDKNGVSRAKLAYICDSTSAPVCSLIPLNAWGGLLLGLIIAAIDSKVLNGNALELLIKSIPFNFYSIITLFIVLIVILKDINLLGMKNAKVKKYIKSTNKDVKPSIYPIVITIFLLVFSVIVSLYLTGKGDILKGSGSTSVYFATIITLIFLYFFTIFTKRLKHKEYFNSFFTGASSMLQIATILILALFINKVIGDLGTAKYLSSIIQGNINPIFMPMLIFLVSAIVAFSTGTSWGTFSIMMPIALTIGADMNLYIPLVIGAVVSGGIFGDHSSPISDTTIISSMAAGCDHIEHVKTQLPYALIGAFLASILFLATAFATCSN